MDFYDMSKKDRREFSILYKYLEAWYNKHGIVLGKDDLTANLYITVKGKMYGVHYLSILSTWRHTESFQAVLELIEMPLFPKTYLPKSSSDEIPTYPLGEEKILYYFPQIKMQF